MTEFMPELSAEEVQRFVELDKLGWALLRAGDPAAAEAAFRGQIAIYAFNPQPHVSLALLEAGRGSTDAAVQHLREAVVRGFTDLRRIERAEAWSRTPRTTAFLKLIDALPAMAEAERRWPEWGSFAVWRAPDDVDTVLQRREELLERLDAMAPALGERMTRLWKRTVDRAGAAMLAAYVERRREAPDHGRALEHLMALYAGGPVGRWQYLPADVAGPLAEAAELLLEKFPQSEMRPAALVGAALARNTDRNKRGVLRPEAAREIVSLLEQVATAHADSPLLSAAMVGLVRTEVEAGRSERAAERYREFRREHADDLTLQWEVQRDLGELGLRVGGLPPFRAVTLDGRTVEPEALRGKVVVLDFWATWCAPCIEEFPALRRIDERHGDDVVLLGVNLDWTEELSVEALREWIESRRVPGEHVHDGRAWDSEIVKAFGVREIPFNVVVGADGEVLAVNQKGRRLEKAVNGAVRRAPDAPETAPVGTAGSAP